MSSEVKEDCGQISIKIFNILFSFTITMPFHHHSFVIFYAFQEKNNEFGRVV